MLLDEGNMVVEGETQAVVNHYLQNMTNSVLEQVWENRETAREMTRFVFAAHA